MKTITAALALLLFAGMALCDHLSAGSSKANASENRRVAKFYVEIPFEVKQGQIFEVTAPVTSMGTLEPLGHMGITVWPENDWKETRKRLTESGFPKSQVMYYKPGSGWTERPQ